MWITMRPEFLSRKDQATSSCKTSVAGERLSMAEPVSSAVSRRRFLYAVAVAAAPVAFLARVKTSLGQDQVELDPTPAAGEKLKLTPEETAGPFFKPNSPAKKNFRDSGVTGTPVNLTGTVLDRRGKPIANALLDFWHADANGEYDFSGFRCRGHQFSDSDGKYALETVMPGLYPGRTRHYHVRLQAAHGSILSTQLYFPGEARNSTDSLFKRDLLLKIRESSAGQVAVFNFVLETI
jgi:protocatechuate 3,4-dioxygenase beta subunit